MDASKPPRSGKNPTSKEFARRKDQKESRQRSAERAPQKRSEHALPARLHPVALPFFRRFDWLCAGATALLVLAGYLLTLAPDLTLEDSGEMAVASAYAGVPHAPGYPVWTLYTWLVTKLLPFSNIAWRVAVASAVAGALACGLISLMTSRATAIMLERWPSSDSLGDFPHRPGLQRWLPPIGGFISGMLMGFDGLLWSQAVIVEVYALSVLSLTGVIALLFRWMYTPQQRRHLYLAWFMFGLCLNNHQSLIVIVLAMEVCVLLADRQLGRDLLLGNSLCYLAGLYIMANGGLKMLSANNPLLAIFHVVGLASIVTTTWLAIRTRGLGSAAVRVAGCGGAVSAGLALYLLMPLFSMTNPPMNWAYPRTAAGFLHCLTRGQYDSVHPVTSVGQYLQQLWTVAGGIGNEFYLVFLVIGLAPFLFWRYISRQERCLILGLVAFYLTLGPLLLVLLNPGSDRTSQSIVKVFFAASHVPIAIAVGCGFALASWRVWRGPDLGRRPILMGCAAAAAWGLWHLATTWGRSGLPMERAAALFGFAFIVGVGALVLWRKTRVAEAALLALLSLAPVHSVLDHWWGNEQRGHLFGFWFGHDMFCPPFKSGGELTYSRAERARLLQANDPLIYPEMSTNAVLFGGTDPGRFCPTYMIFCESFLPPSQRRNPEFDRRDVRIITQNALADAHYLEYIRAHYQRTAQTDPYFLSELLGVKCGLGLLGRLVLPLDRLVTRWGTAIEKTRRQKGVYPSGELELPANEDLHRRMNEYAQDLQARAQRGQLRPGEEIRIVGNQMIFSGQATVMGVNALLTRDIFLRNPGHEFYLEESFPLEWMYPHLEPFGTIMKLQRTPLPELGVSAVERDRKFWRDYMGRLVGDWVKPETNVADICNFAEAVHLRRDLNSYTGDRKFLRDEQAQKGFSKLRTSIGGLYDWRFRSATGQLQQLQVQLNQASSAEQLATFRGRQQQLLGEQQRMFAEAEFAYKQAFALCPYSPETVQRFVNLLASVGRWQDALGIAEISSRLDPHNAFFTQVAAQLRNIAPATMAR